MLGLDRDVSALQGYPLPPDAQRHCGGQLWRGTGALSGGPDAVELGCPHAAAVIFSSVPVDYGRSVSNQQLSVGMCHRPCSRRCIAHASSLGPPLAWDPRGVGGE
jgi:hypothetical protein